MMVLTVTGESTLWTLLSSTKISLKTEIFGLNCYEIVTKSLRWTLKKHSFKSKMLRYKNFKDGWHKLKLFIQHRTEPKKCNLRDNLIKFLIKVALIHGRQGLKVGLLPGFSTQRLDFIFLDELTASELLYLTVQITDVPHSDTHRESCSHTLVTHSEHTHWIGLTGAQSQTNLFVDCSCRLCKSDCWLEKLQTVELWKKIRRKIYKFRTTRKTIQENSQCNSCSARYIYSLKLLSDWRCVFLPMRQ